MSSKIDKALEDKINDLIDQRESARKNKDFDTADKIRDEIEVMGKSLKIPLMEYRGKLSLRRI